MKNEEYYSKSKPRDKFLIRPYLTKTNWWIIAVLSLLIIAYGPIQWMKHKGVILFSWDNYFHLVLLAAALIIPLETLVLWFPQIRLILIQKKGFDWIGKFEVIDKEFLLGFHYLVVHPGTAHKLKVDADVYHKIKIGDDLLVRRNALGDVKEAVRVPNMHRRVMRCVTAERKLI
ncbi:MAG: hypothetical protein HOP08_12530 [Cyclobacteriaceae bacterium]|nr:hypothetical protein [Cyclobacteriaceae bacterium]